MFTLAGGASRVGGLRPWLGLALPCVLVALAAACGATRASGPAAQTGAPSLALPAPSAAVACRHEAPPCASGAPSFADEVEPILKSRCFACHTGDGPAADERDFSSPDRVLGQRRAIREAVASCAMPPRTPLLDAEASTLLRWAACAQDGR